MPRKSKAELEAEAREIAQRFSQLDDDQIVGIRVVAIRRDRSVCSIWRDVKAGREVAPAHREGKAGWRVGDLRAAWRAAA